MDFGKYSKGKSWVEYLEVVISGHTEPVTGTACPLESSDFRDICNQRNFSNQVPSRLRLESWVGNPISHSLSSVTLGYTQGEFFLYWNYGHDMKPIAWWSYRARVNSSLILLGIFHHPYPTLVVTKILRSHSPFGSDFRILPSAPIQRYSVAVYYPTDEDCINDCPNRLVSVYLDRRIPSKSQIGKKS